MRKFLAAILALITVFSAAAMSGCGDNNTKTSSKPASENETADTPETTAEPETQPQEENAELEDYINSFFEGKEALYGAWKLSSLDYMYIIFRNDNIAELAMDGEGYFSKYKLDKKEGTLAVQLLPGSIDGIYNYDFSDDNTRLTLSLDGETLELIKEEDFSMIPKAHKNPKIDPDILGWWENEDGMVYYFGRDGRMYNNAIVRETFYTYNAEDGKIKAVYNYGGDMEETLSYKLKGEKLIIDKETYTKK